VSLSGRLSLLIAACRAGPFALVAGDRIDTIHDDVVTRWRMKA
jgi:hypothetical protein